METARLTGWVSALPLRVPEAMEVCTIAVIVRGTLTRFCHRELRPGTRRGVPVAHALHPCAYRLDLQHYIRLTM